MFNRCKSVFPSVIHSKELSSFLPIPPIFLLLSNVKATILCLSVYLYVCIYVSVHLSVCLYTCMYVHLSVSLSVYLYVHLSVCLYICMSLHLPLNSIWEVTHLRYQSVCPNFTTSHCCNGPQHPRIVAIAIQYVSQQCCSTVVVMLPYTLQQCCGFSHVDQVIGV